MRIALPIKVAGVGTKVGGRSGKGDFIINLHRNLNRRPANTIHTIVASDFIRDYCDKYDLLQRPWLIHAKH